MQPPNLDHAALTHQLTRMFAGNRGHRPLIAIHGTCDDPRPIALPGVGRFEVVLADSELALRGLLPEPANPAPPRTVYLVPWTTHLPLDIAGRFAHDGRVFRIDAEVRISRLFTAPFETIDPEVLGSKLAAWLLREPPPAPLPTPGGRLTFHGLWNTWLRHDWAIDLDECGLGTLLAWAASNGLGPRLAAALASAAAEGVRAEFDAILRARFGDLAPAILDAWLHERGAALLGFAILCETLAPKADEDRALRTWLALKAAPLLGERVDASQRHKLVQRLAALVPPALGELGRTQQRIVLRIALDAADALVDEHVEAALIDSPRLLFSWRQRLAALGDLLSAAAPNPGHEHLAAAVLALRRLEQHDRPRYSRDGRAAAELARAEAGVRLLAWLVARADAPAAASHPAERAEQLARWYIDEGSYLDSARHGARGPGNDRFGAGVAAIVARADDERRELDRQFVEGLVAASIRRTFSQAIPITDALERLAARFLKARPTRRVLVILLADMAWTQAIDLLASLEEDASRWGPIAWQGHGAGLGAVPCPAVLATIPAIAPLCRSALLAGERASPGALPAAGGDPKRLAEHPTLKRLLPGPAPLFLRRALDDSAGSEVLAQIRDPQARLVAVILDAVDASLADDARPAGPWRARNIRPLFELLDAAQAAGRAVLLASDHGHVPADRLQHTGERGSRGGARWRPWTAGTTVHSDETGFMADDAWGPRGSKGVLVLHDETHRYTQASSHAAEHGGASLAEVVTPMFLLGWEGMDTELDDPDLALRAAAPPRWWHLHVEPPPLRETTRRPRTPRKDPAPQLTLMPLAPPAAPTPGDTYHPITRQLLDSPLFRARAAEPKQHELTLRAIEALLRHENAASEELLAPALGVPARRVGGFIVKASEILNIDGYAVLHHDPIAHRAELRVELLRQCFELPRV